MHGLIDRGSRLLVAGAAVVALAGCPTETMPVFPFGETAAGSTTDNPGITTFGGTFDPTMGDPTPMEGDGTTGGSTTMALDGTTSTGSDPDTGTTSIEPGTTSDTGSTGDTGTTSGSSSGMMGSSSSGMMGGSSSSSSSSGGSTSTGAGSSTGPVCHDVPGNYDNCLDMMGAVDTTPCNAPGDATCLFAGDMANPLGGVCAIEDCIDPCDCPEAPLTGTAPVACSDVTGDPAQLFCSLDCSMGETCPTGMTCFGGFLCLWPTPFGAGDPYGDCFNNPTDICGIDGICLNDDVMAPTIGVCTTDCPGGVGDCPAAPPGGASPVACNDLTGDGADECFLDCSGGAACPPGMTCFANLCVWN